MMAKKIEVLKMFNWVKRLFKVEKISVMVFVRNGYLEEVVSSKPINIEILDFDYGIPQDKLIEVMGRLERKEHSKYLYPAKTTEPLLVPRPPEPADISVFRD